MPTSITSPLSNPPKNSFYQPRQIKSPHPRLGTPPTPKEQKSTPQWQLKSPALGQPTVLMDMNKKSIPPLRPDGQKVHTPVAAQVPSLEAAISLDGHEQKVPPPSARMDQKSTPQWQLKSPASGQPSASIDMNKKSTSQWQTKSPASGQPSAPMEQKWGSILLE